MWRTSDQVVLGAEGALLSQQQHQSLSHDLFQRHHQTQLPELQHSDPPRPQSSDQLNGLHHALPQALSEAFQCQAADLPNMQLAPDNVTLQAALGLGGENVLAQVKRNLGDQSGQSSPELSAILAASLGMLPGQISAGPDALSGPLEGAQDSLTSCKLEHEPITELPKSASTTSQLKSELGDDAESDNHSEEGDGSVRAKRKGPMTEEDKKRRRQEINRQSARRIRERRSHEMARLKQQNAALQQQHTMLLKYASTLAREKNMLVQRTLELTERWNQAAAENLELRERNKSDSAPVKPGTPAAGSLCHSQVQNALPQNGT